MSLTPPIPRADKRRTVLRVLGALCLLAAVVAWVDLDGFRASLAQVGPGAVIALLAIATADRWLMAAKWQHIATGVGFSAPFSSFLSAYYGASFLSYALPTTLGGDVYRVLRGRREAPLAQVLASMVAERIVGLLASLVLAVAGLLWLLSREDVSGGFSLPGGAPAWIATGVLAMVIAVAASFAEAPQRWLLSLARRIGLERPVAAWLQAHRKYAHRPGLLVANAVLALVENGAQIAILYVAAREIGVETPLLVMLSIISLARFVRRLSMLLDGWGFSEALHILLFGWVGIDGGTALAISLVAHAAGFVASVPGALFVWVDRRDVKAIRERTRTNDQTASPLSDPEVVRDTILRDSGRGKGESAG